MNGILLTGVTGSLGGHLAVALLRHTQATLYCLVRADSHEQAHRRLSERLAELAPVEGQQRLVAVPAEITRPNLGLTPRMRAELVENIQAVHHCAADVQLTATYRQLAPMNLGGTRELLGLAAEVARRAERAVAFHFVSTLGVFLDARRAGTTMVDETTEPTMDTAGDLGYPRTKVAAEREVGAARDRGITPVIYRPGVITAHSATACTSKTDMLVSLLCVVAVLGAVPESIGTAPLETVDEVARQIAVLSVSQTEPAPAYHIIRPRPVPLRDAVAALERAGYRLQEMPADDWRDLLDSHATHPAVARFTRKGLAGLRLAGLDPGYAVPDFRSDRSWATLHQAGVRPAALDDAYYDRLVADLSRQLS